MRLRLALLAISLFLGACTVTTTSADPPYGEGEPTPPTPSDPAAGAHGQPAPNPRAAQPTVPADGVLPEVAYLFMWDTHHQGWMCTATLVARDTVVTAAHCLDT